MSQTDVSIIVINYNTFELTCNCIESIYKVTNDVVFEVIVVDNASSEIDPVAFLKRFPQISLVKSQVNLGFAGGNNLGIKAANGDLILLLNSDTILLNNAVLLLKQFLMTHPDVAVVSGRLEYADGRPQHNCQRFPSVRYKMFELLRLQHFLPKSTGGKVLLGSFFDHREVTFPDWVWGTCFMFPRKLLSELPGSKLADDFFMYGEDMQWCIEFKKRGYRIGFEPAARVLHLMGMSGASKNEMMEQNMLQLMKKYYSAFHRKCIEVLDQLL